MRTILIMLILVCSVAIMSCKPRIEMDLGQWGDHAIIENVQLFKLDVNDEMKIQEWYENETLVTGVRHVVISEGSAVIDNEAFTATIKLKAEEDITRIGIKFWHKAALIEPLNGAPKAGTVNDFSKRSSRKLTSSCF